MTGAPAEERTEYRDSELRFWDGVASRYAHRARPSLSTLSFSFAVDSDVAFLDALGEVRGMKILDVGCGFGDLSILLADMGAEVYGLDFTRSMVTVARARACEFAPQVCFVVGDAQLTPFGPEEFDAVVAMRAVHHFPDIPGFLREVRRVLKPGGKAVFIEPQKANPIVELNRRIFRPEQHSEHEHALTTKDIDAVRTIFPKNRTDVFYLVSPAAFVFDRVLKNRKLFEKSYKGLQRMEAAMRRLSMLNRFYWQVLIVTEKECARDDSH